MSVPLVATVIRAGPAVPRVRYVAAASADSIHDRKALVLPCVAPPTAAYLLACSRAVTRADSAELLAAAREAGPEAHAPSCCRPIVVNPKAAEELGQCAVAMLAEGTASADPDPPDCTDSSNVLESRQGEVHRPTDFINYTPRDYGAAQQRLAVANAHARDARVRFVESTHSYFLQMPDGTERKTSGSVTYLAHKHQADSFDACKVAKRMMQGKNWPQMPYFFGRSDVAPFDRLPARGTFVFVDLYGAPVSQVEFDWSRLRRAKRVVTAEAAMDEASVCAEWAINGMRARNRGTEIHLQIELYLNGLPCVMQYPEIHSFGRFMRDVVHRAGWEVTRTEMAIFCEESNIAGMIDMVATASDGSLVLVDWKRSDKVRTQLVNGREPWAKSMLVPLDHLDNCAAAGYALQLNLYKYILERHYGYTVAGMVLSQVHPDNSFYTFVPPLPLEAEYIMACARFAFDGNDKHRDEVHAAERALRYGRRCWQQLMPAQGIDLDAHLAGTHYVVGAAQYDDRFDM